MFPQSLIAAIMTVRRNMEHQRAKNPQKDPFKMEISSQMEIKI